MSSKLTTSPDMRCDCSLISKAMSCCSAANPGLEANASALPASEVNGVRKSCEMADSKELRKRSDSILTKASCATSA